ASSLGFLLVVAVADNVGDVLVPLLLLLDEGSVVHALVFDLHILFAALGRLAFWRLLALRLGIRLFQRAEFSLPRLRRHRLFFSRGGGIGNGRRFGPRPRSDRRELQDRVAFRADDRILVEVVKFRGAVGAEALGAELGFRHGSGSLGGSKIEVLHLASRTGGVNSRPTGLSGRAGAPWPVRMTPLRLRARERQTRARTWTTPLHLRSLRAARAPSGAARVCPATSRSRTVPSSSARSRWVRPT